MPTLDPLQQWQVHLTQIGDIATVWREFTGRGVQVGIYDDGFDYTHEDLAANYDPGLNFVWQGVEQVPNQYAGHGTPVSGILAGVQGNGVGGSGVAPGVTFTTVAVDDGAVLTDYQLAALRHARTFDVMSNSWLRNNDFRATQSLAIAGSEGAVENAAYAQIATNGRSGLGTVIVQAAGNDFSTASGAALNVSRYTVTVAATDNTGNIHDYSNWGSSILVAAPAAGVTTDVMGNLGVSGYNAPDALNYTYGFGGTSGATPVVSGVVALMLQANPELGWRDVQNILAFSAAQTGSAFGTDGTGSEVGSWQSVGGTMWNGGGTALHASYGYGMVDAFAAVRMAEAWRVFYFWSQTSSNSTLDIANYAGSAAAIADAGEALTLTNRVTRSHTLETIYVTVEMAHENASDLTLALRAPDGTMVDLLTQVQDDGLMDNGFRWTFAVEGLRGYNTAGDWSLIVQDSVGGNTGVVTDFDIRLFGSIVARVKVHHFTDDFLLMAAVEPDRRLITGVEGTRDWLNFAGVHGNLTANLSEGGNLRVDGVIWAQVGQAIDAVFASDGNDLLIGSDGSNRIWGRRGNDTLSGGDGRDDLVGGYGMDIMTGGDGSDRLAGSKGNDLMTGGAGEDSFLFRVGFGRDRITDFTNNVDQLRLDDALWTGEKTVLQVIEEFGSIINGNAVLTFGMHRIVLTGLAAPRQLFNDMEII